MAKDKYKKLEDELKEFSQPHIEAELKKMGKGASGGNEEVVETQQVTTETKLPVDKKKLEVVTHKLDVAEKKVTPKVVDMTPVVKEIKPRGFGK